jgi:plastocyanin
MNLAALGNAVTLLAEAGYHEKSKTAFYIGGGALALWAVVVGVFGFTHPDFPGSPGRARLLMGISFVFMVGAMATAAITGSTPPGPPKFVHVKLLPKGTAPAPTLVSQPTPATTSAPAPAAAAGAPAAPGTTAIAADPGGVLKFTTDTLSAKAGKVTIAFANASPVPHNLAVAKGSKQLGITPTFAGGGTKKLVLKLAAGSYTFYCTVPGHRQAGMQGTLTVN